MQLCGGLLASTLFAAFSLNSQYDIVELNICFQFYSCTFFSLLFFFWGGGEGGGGGAFISVNEEIEEIRIIIRDCSYLLKFHLYSRKHSR